MALFDSQGGTSVAKAFILSRLLLFARQADTRRKGLDHAAVLESLEWRVEENVHRPMQQDNQNCGLLAFKFLWCSIYGVNVASLPVVGDHLQHSLIHSILNCGPERREQRAMR